VVVNVAEYYVTEATGTESQHATTLLIYIYGGRMVPNHENQVSFRPNWVLFNVWGLRSFNTFEKF
jgi:hypothetical protein